MRISDWSSDVCSSDLPVLGFRRQFAFAFQLSDCCAVAGCLVGIEFGRLFPVLQATKSFAQKALRRFGAACRCQIEINRVVPFVDRPVQVGPFAPHLYVGLIQTRSEEHTSELQSLIRTSFDVFSLQKKTNQYNPHTLSSITRT